MVYVPLGQYCCFNDGLMYKPIVPSLLSKKYPNDLKLLLNKVTNSVIVYAV
jgi:hypothetical protein